MRSRCPLHLLTLHRFNKHHLIFEVFHVFWIGEDGYNNLRLGDGCGFFMAGSPATVLGNLSQIWFRLGVELATCSLTNQWIIAR